jgi:hypothetical protein
MLDLESSLSKAKRSGRLSLAALRRFLVRNFWGTLKMAFIFFLVIMVIVALTHLFGGVLVELSIYTFLLVMALSLFPVIAIHELGHVAAGICIGMRFKKMRVGPLSIRKQARKLEFASDLDGGLGGRAQMEFVKLRKARRKLLVTTAGGPAASFLSGTLAWIVLAKGLVGPFHHVAVQFLEVFSIFSIVLSSMNLLPFKVRGGPLSDGAVLLSLLSKRGVARRIYMHAVIKHGETVVRPKLRNRRWIANGFDPKEISTQTLHYSWMAYYVDVDRENIRAAAQSLEKCLQCFSIAPREWQQALLLEAALFQAWHRQDAHKAGVWFERAKMAGPFPPLQQIRADVCMNWVNKRYAEAESAWTRGFLIIEKSPASTLKEIALESWLEWKGKMAQRRASLPIIQTSPEGLA